MSGTIIQTVTSTTDPDEIQVRNAQDHARVYDPVLEAIVLELLGELKQIRQQLEIITGEEVGDT